MRTRVPAKTRVHSKEVLRNLLSTTQREGNVIMVNKHKPVRKNKTAVITIRIEDDRKKLIQQKAARCDLSLSRYLTELLENGKIQPREDSRVTVHNAVIIQQICNYIAENYGNDSSLEGWCRELWESLS